MCFHIITKNINIEKSIFDQQLRKHLPYPTQFNLNLNEFNINPKKNSKNNFKDYYRNKDSLFYNSFKLKNTELYVFGLTSSLNNSKYTQFDSDPIVLSFNDANINESAIVFVKKGTDIFLFIKVMFNKSLSNNEERALKNAFDIHELSNGKSYINFGNLNDFPQILSNISFFIKNNIVNKKSHTFLNVKSVHISPEMSKILKSNKKNSKNIKKDNDPVKKEDILKSDHICSICREKIADSYENNPWLVNFAGVNEYFCAECYSKILVSYFIMRISEKYTNKSYLFHVNNLRLIRSYIELSERLGAIGKSYELDFNVDFSEYRNYTMKIPKKLKIKKFPEGRKGISERVNIIDDETLEYDRLSNDFKKLLFNSNLSENDGWDIRKKLIKEALSFDLRKTHKHTKERINQIISSKFSKKNSINIFKLVNKLNQLTLNNKGELNKRFVDDLLKYNLNIEEGRVIREIIIFEVENFILITEDEIESRIGELVHDNYHANQEKFYFKYNDSYNLNASVNDFEFILVFNMLQNLSCSIESCMAFKLKDDLLKINIEFKSSLIESHIFDILEKIGFRNLNLVKK